jgi:Peptide N-acetyl-beta-D-glucosaminyl asparaginase amidase A
MPWRGPVRRWITILPAADSRFGLRGEELRMQSLRILRRVSLMLALAAAALANVGAAGAGIEVDYQNPITAVQPIARPPTHSCTVTVMQDFAFNSSVGHDTFDGTLSPPADCPGPWSKIVLDFTGRVAGRQFDRLMDVWLGGAEIFQSTTPEPDPSGITWHVEHDATRYSSVFAWAAPIKVRLANYVTSVYTGVIYGTLTVSYYQATPIYPAPQHADEVIGFPNADSEYFYNPDDVRTTTATVPRNLTAAYLELYLKGNSCDEFWYGSQPDDYAGPNGLCGGGAFREIQVSIDGQLAGVAWPFPFIFTGGVNPLLWRPIPAVNAFDMPPQTVDLTPYVGLLTDGQPHTISLRVAHDGYYWGIAGDLLLYRDPALAQTTGAVTSRSIGPTANESYQEKVGSNSGVFTTTASRHIVVSGYVDTSAGRITTTVDQTFGFQNKQELDLVNFLENLRHEETIETLTTTSGPGGTTVRRDSESYPITMRSIFQVPHQGQADFFNLDAGVLQALERTTSLSVNGVETFAASLSDSVNASGLLSRTNGVTTLSGGRDSEDYDASDSRGACYHHQIVAAQGWVKSDRLLPSC